ncbi:Metallo-dependent phosphatase-like protein [Crepidotus variabilis]|uniref:Metallo-dependent phosphatase-like protein n=1 Tax=Crepidotus variabilis TaxID=179855 RepID=A0A9P6EHJ5_9AGAR|nr:Metallo-dependent phosphatase-like protein [Crepidotus variabilis]
MLLKFSVLLGLAISYNPASACPDGDPGHSHAHSKRATPSVPLPPPSRPLTWGDVNIIHTTDSHGWLLGHQKKSSPEPNYSGDFGDFSSFVSHMKQTAAEKDVDLLLVDSGDLHDGTGLVDGYPAGGVDAHDANEFFKQLPYDLLAIGNHELYIYNNTLDMHKNFAPQFKGRYLSSNVNLTYVDQNGEVVNTPVGDRFAKFKTRKGRKVTALGVLFDFTGNDKNTTVQKVEDMVNERWFKDAIKEEPDFFLLAGHMPVAKDKWPLVFNAVRALHPTTPILILGGHTHVRDCIQLDGRSMSLESGRYMETLGWMSVNLDRQGSKKNLTFSRRYLDPNRVTYEYHTKQSDKSFDTNQGQSIKKGLQNLAKKFNLDFLFGTAPHDYTISQSPYPGNASLLSLFIEQAAPVALTLNNSLATKPYVMITNSGSQRFDIYAGPFTKNDQLTASPFADKFLYISNVTYGVAKQVLPSLNNAGANQRRAFDEELYARGEVETVYRRWLEDMDRRSVEEIKRRGLDADAKNLTLGYVTQDSCPGIGDDTLHTPLPYFSSPPFVGSNPPSVTDDTPIDLVFVDFIATQLVPLLNKLQNTTTYTADDAKLYSPVLSSEVLGIFAQQKWN